MFFFIFRRGAVRMVSPWGSSRTRFRLRRPAADAYIGPSTPTAASSIVAAGRRSSTGRRRLARRRHVRSTDEGSIGNERLVRTIQGTSTTALEDADPEQPRKVADFAPETRGSCSQRAEAVVSAVASQKSRWTRHSDSVQITCESAALVHP